MRLRLLLALPCILVPAALRAQGPADVRGKVVDAATGGPVAGAVVELKDLGRRAVADSAGGFAFQRVPAGTHQWVITRVGYARWEESSEVADGDEFTIALPARAAELEGITAIASQLQHRRDVSGVSVRTLERTTLRLTAAPSAFELVHDHLGVAPVPCPPRTGGGNAGGSGDEEPTPPTAVSRRRTTSSRARFGGPTNGDGGDVSCAWVRGNFIRPTVFIDEQRATGGLADLKNVRPQELYTVESYSGGQMIRVITVWFADRLASGRAELLPLRF